MTATYSFPDTVIARELGDELVLLDLAEGTYFGLDSVGAAVWQCLADGANIEEVCSALLAKFDVAEDVLRQDVSDLLAQLETKGLVTQVD